MDRYKYRMITDAPAQAEDQLNDFAQQENIRVVDVSHSSFLDTEEIEYIVSLLIKYVELGDKQ